MIKLRFIIGLLLFFGSNLAVSQNIFPIKLDHCVTDHFCLDCGEVRGGMKEEGIKQAIENFSSTIDLSVKNQKVYFQVLIDSLGTGCVLSHNVDVSSPDLMEYLINYLNQSSYWTPAIENGKVVDRTSINFVIEIKNHKLLVYVEKVDAEKLFGKPERTSKRNLKKAKKNKT